MERMLIDYWPNYVMHKIVYDVWRHTCKQEALCYNSTWAWRGRSDEWRGGGQVGVRGHP